MNASLTLFFPEANNTVPEGVDKKIGLIVKYAQHIKSISLHSSCGNFDTVFTPSSMNYIDTLFFYPVFNNAGECTFSVIGEMQNNQINERTGEIMVYVIAGVPTLSFSATPIAFITNTGKIDTLRYAVNSSNISNITYSSVSNPVIDPGEMYLTESSGNDSAFIYFNPQTPGVYTVTLTAVGDTLSAITSVPVTVLSSLKPLDVGNPQTLITGMVDTLVYNLTPEQIASGITMELINAQTLPTGIATVIPSSADSIIIALNPTESGELSFSIATATGNLADTAVYTYSIIDQNTTVWKTTAATVDATEGQLCTVPLTPYLSDGVEFDGIAPTVTLGNVSDSGTWSFTPSWGSDATVTATITGKRGETPQNLVLTVNVASGDGTAPEITLHSPATESESVSSSQAAVSVIVKDAGAGVEKVTFATASDTIDGAAEDGDIYSAVITGLPEGSATDVIITATDKSMKKNISSKTIALTYDPTGEDGDAPVMSQTAGPQSGDRVTSATGSITCTVSDDSGVDSVWWTLNGVFESALAASGDNNYTINYTFDKLDKNVITLYAKDGSVSGNKGSKAITLNYNSEPAAIALVSPTPDATGVSTSPTFEWSGGEDTDGDGVTFTVKYGAARSVLSRTAAVTGKTATVNSTLESNTTFYWQVTAKSASTAYPDEVQSDIGTFTTGGNPPEITRHPESQSVYAEESVTFSVAATSNGGGTLSYKWLKNGTAISGAVNKSYTISSTAVGMSGNTYECIVSNTEGEVISNAATLTVIPATYITDVCGNRYRTVAIGNKVWMAENLKTTKYRDGTPIPLVTGNDAWDALTTPGYCWYDNDSATYNKDYGVLYNKYCVNTGMLPPEGWHIPDEDEWATLIGEALGGMTGWSSSDTSYNKSGFTGLPGGGRYQGKFSNIGQNGTWWSTTTTNRAWYLTSPSAEIYGAAWSADFGFSVRCVKD